MARGAVKGGLLALVVIAGCDARERTPSVTPAQPLAVAGPVGAVPVQAAGQAPLSVWVRAVNQYGAAVPSEARPVTVGGVSSSVSFDGVGYGAVTVESPGVADVAAGSTVVSAQAWSTDYEPPGLGPAAVAPLLDVEEAWEITTGSLAVDGYDVWWVDPEGMRPHKVLSMDEPIVGLRVGQVDVDGLDDAVVWTGNTVVLLRGRTGGGMSWGGGFTAPGYTVGGADLGDLSGDNLPDLAIGWAGGEDGGVFDVWNGDGLFGFTASEPRTLGGIPTGVAVADNTGEGRPQATVLMADGTWRRYIEGAPGRYMPIGPDTPTNVILPPGSMMGPPIDLDGDGAAEIHVLGPRTPGQPRQVHLFDIDQGILILSFTDEDAAYVAAGDGDGDLVDDLWLHQEAGRVQALSTDGRGATATYPRVNLLSDIVSHGPIGVDDIDGDGTNDLWIAGDRVWGWTRGRVFRGDETRFWEPQEPAEQFLREALTPPVRTVTLDTDPVTNELLALHDEAGRWQLLVLEDVGGDRSERVGYTWLDDGGAPLDLITCDRRAYVLMSSAVLSVDLSDRTFPIVSATLPLSQPRDLTCGAGPAGSSVAVLDGETVLFLTPTLAEISRTTSAGAFGLTFGDVGQGPEVKVCGSEGCRIAAWQLGDGITRYIVAEAGVLRAVSPDGSFVDLGGRADSFGFADLDGDGSRDLITHDSASGVIGLYRDLGTTISVPQLWVNPIPWEGLVVLDGDRDGVLDFAGIDLETGSLRYLTVDSSDTTTASPTYGGDTGDTGLPLTDPTPTTGSTGSTGDTGTP
jgi:hypothetical protein